MPVKTGSSSPLRKQLINKIDDLNIIRKGESSSLEKGVDTYEK